MLVYSVYNCRQQFWGYFASAASVCGAHTIHNNHHLNFGIACFRGCCWLLCQIIVVISIKRSLLSLSTVTEKKIVLQFRPGRWSQKNIPTNSWKRSLAVNANEYQNSLSFGSPTNELIQKSMSKLLFLLKLRPGLLIRQQRSRCYMWCKNKTRMMMIKGNSWMVDVFGRGKIRIEMLLSHIPFWDRIFSLSCKGIPLSIAVLFASLPPSLLSSRMWL